jgi:putative copper export protein
MTPARVAPDVPPAALPLAATSLVVRWLHVLAATVAVGGSVLTWALLRVDRAPDAEASGVTVARGYEWLFWAAAGTLVATGVGNLGALAPTLPAGRWRATLDLKLLAFLLVLGGSALRVSLLTRVRRHPERVTRRLLRTTYGATAVGLVILLALAEVLAHG